MSDPLAPVGSAVLALAGSAVGQAAAAKRIAVFEFLQTFNQMIQAETSVLKSAGDGAAQTGFNAKVAEYEGFLADFKQETGITLERTATGPLKITGKNGAPLTHEQIIANPKHLAGLNLDEAAAPAQKPVKSAAKPAQNSKPVAPKKASSATVKVDPAALPAKPVAKGVSLTVEAVLENHADPEVRAKWKSANARLDAYKDLPIADVTKPAPAELAPAQVATGANGEPLAPEGVKTTTEPLPTEALKTTTEAVVPKGNQTGAPAETAAPAETLKTNATTEPVAGAKSAFNVARAGGAVGTVFGVHQLYTAYQTGDLVTGAIGAGNVAAGGTIIASTLTRTGGKTLLSSAAGRNAGIAGLALGVAAIGYDSYKEEGTGADDKLAFKAARAGVGAGALAATMAASHYIPNKYVGLAVGIGAGLVTAIGGGKIIDTVKENRIEAKKHEAKKHKAGGTAPSVSKDPKKLAVQEAVKRLNRNKPGNLTMDAFDPKHTGTLSLANLADSNGRFNRQQLKQLEQDIIDLNLVVENTANAELAMVRDNLKTMAETAAVDLARLEAGAAVAAGHPQTVATGASMGINAHDIAHTSVRSSGAARTGSIVSSNASRADMAATSVMDTVDTGHTSQSLAIGNAQQATVAQAQQMPHGAGGGRNGSRGV